MTVKPENLKRALAMMTEEVDATEIKCFGNRLSVKGHILHVCDEDDREVLSVLMADKEFGFAAGHFETAAEVMRDMQKVWFAAAKEMKKGEAA